MAEADAGTTNSSQLRALSDWGNHPAWVEFQRRYDPFLGRCCAQLRLQGADLEEVRQETWIAVARRMQSFVYDPRGTFRGWLWRVCWHEGMDLLKRRKSERGFSWDERDERARLAEVPANLSEPLDEETGRRVAGHREGRTALDRLLVQADEIQAAVRLRIEPHTWEAFWLVGVLFWTVAETAKHLEMSNAAVFKAKARVIKMLREEARRRMLQGIDLRSPDESVG